MSPASPQDDPRIHHPTLEEWFYCFQEDQYVQDPHASHPSVNIPGVNARLVTALERPCANA